MASSDSEQVMIAEARQHYFLKGNQDENLDDDGVLTQFALRADLTN
jgi:hypothetical protein